jgi:3-methyladenine DNA glycosylase AlkD
MQIAIRNKHQLLRLLVVLSFIHTACSTISHFDQFAYQQTTSLKVDALHVMDFSTEEFKLHEADVSKVQLDMLKAYEYEKNRPKNEISTKMWWKLIDSSGALMGGFVNTWKSQGKCSVAYIANKKEQIAFAFDQLAELESRKIKPSDVNQ